MTNDRRLSSAHAPSRSIPAVGIETLTLGVLLAWLLPAFIVMILPPAGTLAVSPDSISYLAVARDIASGKGPSLPTFALFGPATQALTTWPPLFPLLLASGLPPIALQALLLGGLSAVVFLTFATSLRVPALASVLLAWACALSMPLLVDATYVWSEVLALLMVALALWSLAGIDDANAGWRWAGGVVCLALAAYARYAMLLLVPALMLALLSAPLSRIARRIRLALLTPVAMTAMFLPLLLHNLLRSHHLTGAARGASGRGLAANLGDALLTTTSSFAVSRPAQALFVLAVLAALAVALLAVLDRLRRQRRADSADAPQAVAWVARLAWTLALVYLAGMVVLRTLVHFDRLDTRLMSPAVYLLGTGICAALVGLARSPRHRPWERAALALPLAMLLVLSLHRAATQGDRAWHAWRAWGSPEWPINSLLVYTNIRRLQAPAVHGVVLCNRPLLVQFLTGWDVRAIPPGPWSEAELRRIGSAAQALLLGDRRSNRLAADLRQLWPQATTRPMIGAHMLQWSGPPRAARLAAP